MSTLQIGPAIEAARTAAGLSQRALQDRTGISQSTLSRIVSGKREAKMTEIMVIAEATGSTISQLTGTDASRRVQCAARSANGAEMTGMRQQLLRFVELDAQLDDQGIPVPTPRAQA
ncbi:helix-turn-helix domain-containing protein [Kocuria palustris]|uniref:helix-turn-helix domain-containing protein n=1 Tax=Kocuria palustris TaxID=71999 RepID=UPI0011A65854|nr:helix-turn-helix transcriptional regulator [Kocuria palustris]